MVVSWGRQAIQQKSVACPHTIHPALCIWWVLLQSGPNGLSLLLLGLSVAQLVVVAHFLSRV